MPHEEQLKGIKQRYIMAEQKLEAIVTEGQQKAADAFRELLGNLRLLYHLSGFNELLMTYPSANPGQVPEFVDVYARR